MADRQAKVFDCLLFFSPLLRVPASKCSSNEVRLFSSTCVKRRIRSRWRRSGRNSNATKPSCSKQRSRIHRWCPWSPRPVSTRADQTSKFIIQMEAKTLPRLTYDPRNARFIRNASPRRLTDRILKLYRNTTMKMTLINSIRILCAPYLLSK